MSLVFSDTAAKQGLVQEYERELGYDYGDVSGSATLLAEFVSLVNQTIDDATDIAIKSDGRWQFDDSNQTDYPIITTNLVSGQRDYSFTTDGTGNLILDIFKVFVASSSGIFTELQPVDVESGDDTPNIGTVSGRLSSFGTDSFTDGKNVTGTPYRYDKIANALFLDPIPSYNSTNGLKVYVNREASHFASTDTTKKPGFPGIFHKYFYKKPAYITASRKSMPIAGGRLRNGAFTGLLMQMHDIEDALGAYFSQRNKDERPRLTVSRESNR